MERFLILYGWGGSLPPHWQEWLARELAGRHQGVWFPKLPKRYSPKKHQWVNKVKTMLETYRPHTVVCHSLACTLWFHLCNEEEILPVKRLLLVAPPRLNCDIPDISTFFPCDPPKNLKAEQVQLVTSTDDPYMSPEEAAALQQALNVPMKVLEGAGHINEKSGFGPWPWALEWAVGPEKEPEES